MDRLTRDGLSLAFEDVGKGAPPILLIHDLGGDHTTMQAQLALWRSRHRVVAVDLRGHGESAGDGRDRSYGGDANPEDHADDLVWLCYELGLYRPVAVGRGAGGGIAAALAARSPTLLSGVVAVDGDATDEQVNAAISTFLAAHAI